MIPARNEAASIDACLRSVDCAAARVPCPVDVVVVADSCDDDTAARARRTITGAAVVSVIEGRWGGPSPARRAGAGHLLGNAGGHGLDRVWLANTDADGVVAPDWLERQLAHVASGALAVAGVVRLDPAATAPGLLAAFADSYRVEGTSHSHLHAANVGVRADVYRAVGGWRARTMVGEDHHLGRDLAARSVTMVHATDVVVTTSARTTGRVRGGFASVLRRLDVPA